MHIFGKRPLVVRKDSWLARICMRMPMWVPIFVECCRVEQDTQTYVRIGRCTKHYW